MLHRTSQSEEIKECTTKKQIYNTLVLHNLDYCSVVWQECARELRQMLERMQNYGIRVILSKASRSQNEDLRQELGWMTLERRREVGRMKLMHRCVHRQALRCIMTEFNLKTEGNVGSFYQGLTQMSIHIQRNKSLEHFVTRPRSHHIHQYFY